METEKFYFFDGFSEDGSFYFMKNTENRIIVFNVKTNENFEISYQENAKSDPSCIKIFNKFPIINTYFLVCGFIDGSLLIFSLSTKEILFSQEKNNEIIGDIKYNLDSESLYTCSLNQTIIRYDLRSKQQVLLYKSTHKLPFKNVHLNIFADPSEILLSCDKKIFILNLQTREITQKFQTHSKPITFLTSSKNTKLFLTYSEETFLNIFNVKRKSPILTLKTIGHSNLKGAGLAKIKKSHYFVYLQYTDLIQLWALEISLNFTHSKILDFFQIRTKQEEKINNSINLRYNELIICVGHHIDLKFLTLQSIIDKNLLTFNKSNLEKEISKLGVLMSEPMKTKNNIKTNPNAIQINEEYTHVLGDLDFLKENISHKKYDDLAHLIKEQKDFTNKENAVESLSMHLTQSILANDQEMIDFCLKNTDEILIRNTINNLKTGFLAPLLDILVAKIVNYPNKSQNLIKWLKFLLSTKTSYFIGCVDIKEKFGNLQSVLMNKTRNLNKMRCLKQKIDIMRTKGENELYSHPRKKIKTENIYKPVLIIQEGDLETIEETIHEQKQEKQEFLNVSFSDKNSINIDDEFERAVKAHDYEELEKEQEDFIEID